MKIILTVGTRPNLIKITRFRELVSHKSNMILIIVHTGQHYDHGLSNVFFDQFNLYPDIQISLKAKEPVTQMAEIMVSLEKIFKKESPDIVLVPGDVNSTFAAAFTAHKMGIPVGHIESGLRSFDRQMPEEINRILTDEISDYFFVTEASGVENLLNEGKTNERIFHVGNTMIDTLVHFDKNIDDSEIMNDLDLVPNEYILLTFHRPGNVDMPSNQQILIQVMREICDLKTCVFPIHPRTQKEFEKSGLWKELKNLKRLRIIEPLGYFEFQNLVKHAFAVVTDSGGIQEETTFRKVPCLTIRPNTERPITVTEGSNMLLEFDAEIIINQLNRIKNGEGKAGIIPEYWDGNSTERILDVLEKEFS